MQNWLPIRKIAAALITALLASPVVVAADNPAVQAFLVMAPVIVGYLVPDKAALRGGFDLDPDPKEQ